MILEKDLKDIGKFQKTHALKGELNALLDIDPVFFEDGNPLIVNIDGIYVPFYLKSYRTKGAVSYLLTLEGIDSETEAKKFVNATIYAAKEDLLDYYEEDDLEFADDLEGYKVIDSNHGEIGEILYVEDSTDNVLLVVRSKEGKDIYIPYNDNFVSNINDDDKTVYVNLPDELLSLN